MELLPLGNDKLERVSGKRRHRAPLCHQAELRRESWWPAKEGEFADSQTRKLHERLHTRCTLGSSQIDLNAKFPTCSVFAEPSDGLEPSTPSLPCDPNGSRWQPVATVRR